MLRKRETREIARHVLPVSAEINKPVFCIYVRESV